MLTYTEKYKRTRLQAEEPDTFYEPANTEEEVIQIVDMKLCMSKLGYLKQNKKVT